MKFLLINGSLSKTSNCAALLECIKFHMESKGHTANIHNFIDNPLPLYNPNLKDHELPTQYNQFKNLLLNAHGIAIATPLYHGSLTGTLKNALDFLPSTIFANKPIALSNIGGGIRAGHSACEHLRTIVRALSGYVIQGQVGACSDDFAIINNKKTLVDEGITGRTQKMTNELIHMSQKLQS